MNNTFERLEQIKRECSQYLRYTERPMFRGIANASGSVILRNIRHDRRPTSGQTTRDGEFRNFLYNEMVRRETGIVGLRRRAAFMTGDFTESGRYGVPYVIFPVNGSRLMASNAHDSISFMASIYNTFTQVFMNRLEDAKASNYEFNSTLTNILRKRDFRVFTQKIDWSDERDRVDLLGPDGNVVFEQALFDLEDTRTWETIRPVEIDYDQLQDALKQNAEIMLFDVDYYYGVEFDEMVTGMGGDYSDSIQDAYLNMIEMIEEGY